MKEKFKEPRICLSLAILIAGFFPWVKITSGVKVAEASAEAGIAVNGYQTFSYSFLGILIFLLPLVLLVLEFTPQIKLSPFYIVGALIGIVISIITLIFVKSSAASTGAAVSGAGISAKAEVKASTHIGFWIIMIMFVALAIYTLVKDYAINKNTLKEKGFKGAISDITDSVRKELSENVSSVSSSDRIVAANACPICGVILIKGEKVCAKCGAKIHESRENQDDKS